MGERTHSNRPCTSVSLISGDHREPVTIHEFEDDTIAVGGDLSHRQNYHREFMMEKKSFNYQNKNIQLYTRRSHGVMNGWRAGAGIKHILESSYMKNKRNEIHHQ